MTTAVLHLGNACTAVTLAPPGCRGSEPLDGWSLPPRLAPHTWAVPSLFHLGEPPRLGAAVLEAGLADHPATFGDFKDYVAHPAPVGRAVTGRRVSCREAAARFAETLLERLARHAGTALDAVVLVPATRFELGRRWVEALDPRGVRRVSALDEDTAAALGHGLERFRGGPVAVVDAGYGAVRARVVRFDWAGVGPPRPPAILASVTLPEGLADLPGGAAMRHPEAWRAAPPQAAASRVRRVVELLLEEARLAGVDRRLARVLPLGIGCRVPAVRRALAERFEAELPSGEDPEAVIARGGLLYASGAAAERVVQGTYALRLRDPVTGGVTYPVVVEPFTPCPSPGPTASYLVNAVHDGQECFHLEIYRAVSPPGRPESREVIFDERGRIGWFDAGPAPRYEAVTPRPLAVPVDPPGRVGERRFHLAFRVDARRHLVVTVRDLRRDRVLWQDEPLAPVA